MIKFTLYKRITHKYRLGWSYEDEWAEMGEMKALPVKKDKQILIAPSKLAHLNLCSFIEQTLTQSHCRHEHDCCGCASYYARAVRIARRKYLIDIHVSYNH